MRNHLFNDIKPDDIIGKKVFSWAVRGQRSREITATYCIYLYYIYKGYNVITVVSSRSRAFVHDIILTTLLLRRLCHPRHSHYLFSGGCHAMS